MRKMWEDVGTMAEAGGLAGVRKGMAVSGGSRFASVGRSGRGENRTKEVEISPCIVSLRCVRQRCTAVLSKDGKCLDGGSGECGGVSRFRKSWKQGSARSGVNN